VVSSLIVLLALLVSEPPGIFQATGVYASHVTGENTVADQDTAVVKRREWYLVSESWCSHCPAAKKRFLGLGWPQTNILTLDECQRRFGFKPASIPFEFGEPESAVEKTPKPATIVQKPVIVQPSSVMYQGRAYSGRVCNSPGCRMCATIQQGLQRQTIQYQPMSMQIKTPPVTDYSQEPSSMDIVSQAVSMMELKPSDVFCDLGCGDGRAMIAAVKSSGCTAVGIEIDPDKAKEAWANITKEGLESKCSIIIGDARNFDQQRWGVTAMYCYLYPELLAELRGKFDGVRVGVTPYHAVDGLQMLPVGDLWVYDKE